MKAKWLQETFVCPYCREELLTRILITPKRYGYNAEYIKFCEEHGTVGSVWERGTR